MNKLYNMKPLLIFVIVFALKVIASVFAVFEIFIVVPCALLLWDKRFINRKMAMDIIWKNDDKQ